MSRRPAPCRRKIIIRKNRRRIITRRGVAARDNNASTVIRYPDADSVVRRRNIRQLFSDKRIAVLCPDINGTPSVVRHIVITINRQNVRHKSLDRRLYEVNRVRFHAAIIAVNQLPALSVVILRKFHDKIPLSIAKTQYLC